MIIRDKNYDRTIDDGLNIKTAYWEQTKIPDTTKSGNETRINTIGGKNNIIRNRALRREERNKKSECKVKFLVEQ